MLNHVCTKKSYLPNSWIERQVSCLIRTPCWTWRSGLLCIVVKTLLVDSLEEQTFGSAKHVKMSKKLGSCQRFHTVLTSSGRMKTMRKQRYQDSRVPKRTIHCCFRKSP